MQFSSLASLLMLWGSQQPIVEDSLSSCMCGQLTTSNKPAPVTATNTIDSTISSPTFETSAEPAVDIVNATAFALIYGYPLLPYVQWVKPLLSKVGNNTVYSEPGLVSPDDKSVVRPNVDTLYSEVAVDLSHTDLELVIPEVPNGRFYVFPFYDLYGNNFANLGSLTSSPNGTYLMRLQQNIPKAELCSKYQGFINFPTTYGAILIRFVLYNNNTDVKDVQSIQEQIQIIPVDRPGTSDPAAPWLSASLLDSGLPDDAALTWPASFDDIAATQLLNLTARLYPYAPPDNTSDTTRVTTYLTAAGLDLSAGVYISPPNVNFTASNLIINTSLNAQLDSPSSYVNLSGSSWLATAPSLSGDFQSDYVTRANVAWAGYLQLSASVAIYPEYYGLGGSAGTNILNVTSDSALLFTFAGKPPVDGFWSMTAYGTDNFLIPNSANGSVGIYSLGDRSSLVYPDGTLVYGDEDGDASDDDGGVCQSSSHRTEITNNVDNKEFQILMQPADLTPPAHWTRNWLPAPSGGGEFTVNLRYYGPREAITKGDYEEPRVQPTTAVTT